LIGADTFGAIFLSSALRTSELRAVVAARARPRVRIGRAGPPGGCAGRRGERNLADRARRESSASACVTQEADDRGLAPLYASAKSGHGVIVDFTVRIAMASAMAAPTPASENG